MYESQYVALKGVSMNKPNFYIGKRVDFNEDVCVCYIDNIDVRLKSRKKITLKRKMIRKFRKYF